jgi:hypothetical protein
MHDLAAQPDAALPVAHEQNQERKQSDGQEELPDAEDREAEAGRTRSPQRRRRDSNGRLG